MNLDQLKEWQKSGHEALSAQLVPNTINAADRTVDVVWFTGIDVPRVDWISGQRYMLRFDPGGVDLSRLNNGAPVFDNHATYEQQKGKVEKAWTDGTDYKATLRFSKRPEVDGLWQDIQDGIITKSSMGVEILNAKETKSKDGKLEMRTATEWRPFEISTTGLPADFGTTTLSAVEEQPEEYPAETAIPDQGAEAQGDKDMSDQLNVVADAPALPVVEQPAKPAVDEAKLRREAVAGERLRISSIDARLSAAKFSSEQSAKLRKELVDGGIEGEAMSARIFEEMAKQPGEQIPTAGPNVTILHDEGDKLRETMSATLLHRYEPQRYKAEGEPGREWMGYSLMEMSRECLKRKGTPLSGKGPNDVASLALSTSDLPNILLDVANKTLRAGYELYPNTFQTFCRRSTARDFKNINRIQLSGAPAMLKVNEHGEIEHGYLTDSKETYAIATYARILSLTRKTIINDDLSALTRIPEMMGRKAAVLEGDVVWSRLTANAAMSDSVALFHATHNNLNGGGATAITVDSVGAMSSALTLQTGLEGDTLNLLPKYIAVPVALRLTVQKLLTPVATILTVTSGTPAVAAVPSWIQSLIPIVEPRLDADDNDAWYVFADPSQVDTIEYAYLEGQEGMYFETQLGFEVDGLRMKARHDFGAGVMDFRGMARNDGS